MFVAMGSNIQITNISHIYIVKVSAFNVFFLL